MTTLANRVKIRERFRRSIRIDTDMSQPLAMDGFVCSPSFAATLRTMATHVSGTGHGAFTWTGPYGVGKSSLLLALGATLKGDEESRSRMAPVLGRETTGAIWEALPPAKNGWRILPVVGKRARPSQVVGDALVATRMVRNHGKRAWTDESVLDALLTIAKRAPRSSGGLALFIDEMGKFLEGAAYHGEDIHFFQDLAEMASRSGGRLIVVGVLHQSFEDYGSQLNPDVKMEWAKVQGRFVDLTLDVHTDEHLLLLGRAIDSKRNHNTRLAKRFASQLPATCSSPELVARCWPLHPLTAYLIGPMSRRSFGQNQRSLFSFLNSPEPFGFRDFLGKAGNDDLYTPDMLWDYLHANLEPSIMISPGGHLWATVSNALERLRTSGGTELDVRLLKVIGLFNLLGERSGLSASPNMLRLSVSDQSDRNFRESMKRLEGHSLVMYREYNDSYGIFDGSDFDIDEAVAETIASFEGATASTLTEYAGFQPIVAKRHYHETGALRWFETAVVPLTELEDYLTVCNLPSESAGCFVLVVPARGDAEEIVEDRVNRVARSCPPEVLVGVPDVSTWHVCELARRLEALEQVQRDCPQLMGDRVARMEVASRITDLRVRIEDGLRRAIDDAVWHGADFNTRRLRRSNLSAVASSLADARFHKAPRIRNELLNRSRPSSSAAAARNALLRRMALHEEQERLGMEGTPAEWGLFASVIAPAGVHVNSPCGWRFVAPHHRNDPCNLAPTWEVATALLRDNSDRTVQLSEIYSIWRAAPYGVKDGLLPVLGAAFALSHRDNLAHYRDGVFLERMTDFDIEHFTRTPDDIQFRWVDMLGGPGELLASFADVAREMLPQRPNAVMLPIDIARSLVAVYDELPAWVGRTRRLSPVAKRVSSLLRQANDPNKLIFDDLPRLLGGKMESGLPEDVAKVSANLREALADLRQAYPNMLRGLMDRLLVELGVPDDSHSSLRRLRDRASNLTGIGGDHRLESFIVRLARFRGTGEDIEGIAGMAAVKPPRDFADHDIDRVIVELSDLAQQFVRLEEFARVQGRKPNWHAMSIVVGTEERSDPIHASFLLEEAERPAAESLALSLHRILEESGEERHTVLLAALAEVTTTYLDAEPDPLPTTSSRQLVGAPS